MSGSAAAVCRLCLAVNVRLLTIAGSLQQVFEKISDNALHTADARPVAACYVCHAQLRKCLKLMLTSAKAENVLNAIVYSNSQISVHSVSAVDRQANGLCWPLTASGAECFETVPTESNIKTEGIEVSIDYEDCKLEDSVEVAANVCDTECDDEVDPVTLMPCMTEIGIKEEAEACEDFPQPLLVTVFGIKTEDVGPDADCTANENCPSLRETRAEGELRGDGASAQISGCEKQGRADGQVTENQPMLISKTQTHECHVCRRSFKFEGYLKNHLGTHTHEKQHECYICHSRFTRRYTLNSHLKLHTEKKFTEKPYACNVCNKRFTRQYTLHIHAKMHNRKSYECDTCRRRFDRSPDLVNHLKIHSGEKLFQCNICNYNFTKKNTLTKHLRIHSGEKQFECGVCEAKFYRKWNLKLHERTHTGENPYHCNICGRVFRQSPALRFHMRTHTGEKPYRCDVCERRFSRLHHYKAHLTTHSERNIQISLNDEKNGTYVKKISKSSLKDDLKTDKKVGILNDDSTSARDETNFGGVESVIQKERHIDAPFKCSQCDLAFINKTLLLKHWNTHPTNERSQYKCDICQTRFKLKVAFRRHVIDCHW